MHREEKRDPGPPTQPIHLCMRTRTHIVQSECLYNKVGDNSAERSGEGENEEAIAYLRMCEGQG